MQIGGFAERLPLEARNVAFHRPIKQQPRTVFNPLLLGRIEAGKLESMNIDERLEKLVERHEALTQTVELLAAQTVKHDQQIGELATGIAKLLHVIELHEHRLDSHDDRLDGLEGQ